MTSDEMTMGSIGRSSVERRHLAVQSRWWNSTGGGSHVNPQRRGNIKAGDGGAKFRYEWPELDKENWEWMKKNGLNTDTGTWAPTANPVIGSSSCGPAIAGMAASGSGGQAQAVFDRVVQQRDAGRGFLARNKLYIAGAAVFLYGLIIRLFRDP